jgi:ADP-ribose pyrophosphatase
MIEKWQQLESQIVFKTPYFSIRQDRCRLSNEREIDDYYVMQSAEIALIVPYTQDQEFVLVKQYKHGIGDICLEIPGGMCELESFDILADAKRELREETGYESDSWHKLATLIHNPARSNNHIHIYLALDATIEGEQSLDPNEEINVHLMPQQNVMTAIRDSKITATDSVAGLMLALDWLTNRA